MWLVQINCLMSTDSFSLPGTCSFHAALSQCAGELDGQKQVSPSAAGESTLRNHQEWQLWVSAVAWKRGENLHPAIFTSFCWRTWSKVVKPPHKGAEGCLVLKREIFCVEVSSKWKTRVCPMFQGLQDNTKKLATHDHSRSSGEAAFWSLAQKSSTPCKECRTEIIAFLTLIWENVLVSAQNKPLNCTEFESYGQRNGAPKSS